MNVQFGLYFRWISSLFSNYADKCLFEQFVNIVFEIEICIVNRSGSELCWGASHQKKIYRRNIVWCRCFLHLHFMFRRFLPKKPTLQILKVFGFLMTHADFLCPFFVFFQWHIGFIGRICHPFFPRFIIKAKTILAIYRTYSTCREAALDSFHLCNYFFPSTFLLANSIYDGL